MSSAFSDKRLRILGVPIDAVTVDDAVRILRGMLDADGPSHVMTPNNEMLVEACHNPRFLETLRAAALNLPDSSGLRLAAALTGQTLPARAPGADVVSALCRSLDARHGVFLLGAAPGIAERAAEALRSGNPALRVAGTFSGSPRSEEAGAIVRRVNESGASLLLVAFGAPAQDLWIRDHLAELPAVRVAMGVGGTFDFLAGVRSRAPRWMRAAGLEWLWRFLQEPRRYKRMWNAVVVFPLLVLRHGKSAPAGAERRSAGA